MFNLFAALLLYLFMAVKPTQAYLDPGTGSYITQIAIGFLVGGGYLFKTYWQKIVSFLRSFFGHNKKNEEKKDS